MLEDKERAGLKLAGDADHSFIWLGAGSHDQRGVVQTMQYLVMDQGRGLLLDPGGVHLFPRVVAAVSRHIALDRIDKIFFSHQDPDVSSGIALWLGVTPAKIHISSLWTRFLPHFGIVDNSRIQPIEETGAAIRMQSGAELVFVPSHYMHSPAAFSLFDRRTRILFTGDIGAAVFPEGQETLWVDDFAHHVQHVEGFHRRLIASNAVARRWVANVRRLDPLMIAPQHGAVYRGAAVGAFLGWLEGLRCGVDDLDKLYRMS